MFWKAYQDFGVTVWYQLKTHYLFVVSCFQYRRDVIFAYFSVLKGTDYAENVFSLNFELIHVHIFISN